MTTQELAAHNAKVVENRNKRAEVKKNAAPRATTTATTTITATSNNNNSDKNNSKEQIQELKKQDLDSDDDPLASDAESDGEGSDFEEVLDGASSVFVKAEAALNRHQQPGTIRNRNLTDSDIMSFAARSVSENSKKQYQSVKNALTNRGFEISFRGLISFMVCRDADCIKVCNSTIEGYISAVKHIMMVEQHIQITPWQLDVLRLVQAARRRIYPDSKRMTGAMNHERTSIFIEFLKKIHEEGRITKEVYQLFVDAARMLYGGALRFFQLVLLEPKGNLFPIYDENGKLKDLLIEVTAKASEKRIGENSAPAVDNKQIHPLYQEHVLDIVKRRGHNTILFHDFPAHRQQFANLIHECSVIENWPVEHRFSGTHMFRHGAAQDAFLLGGLELTVLRTGHLSKKAAREYARSDAERSELAAKYKRLDEKARLAFCDDLNKKAMDKAKEAFRSSSTSAYRPHDEQQVAAVSAYKSQEHSKNLLLRTDKVQVHEKRAKKETKVASMLRLSAFDDKPGNLDRVLLEGREVDPNSSRVRIPPFAVTSTKVASKVTLVQVAAIHHQQFLQREEQGRLEAYRLGMIKLSDLPSYLKEKVAVGVRGSTQNTVRLRFDPFS